MTYPLIFAGLILGGILTILCVVFAIVSLSNGKNKNALIWAGGFVVSIIVVSVSLYSFWAVSASRLKDALGDISAKQNDLNELNNEYDKNERQYRLDTLQKYTNEMYEGKVPADFYINKPAEVLPGGRIRLPFVFPYYISYNKDTYTGNIMMEGSDSIFVENVSAMAIDQNFALIKVDNSTSPEALKANHAETEYLLYDLRTRNYESAMNMDKLLDLGRRIGYTGQTYLSYLSDDYKAWTK